MKIFKGFDISCWQNWTEIFHRQNWYNFTFIHAEAEYAPYKDVIEVTLGLIGFNVCFSYYDPKYVESLEERFEGIKVERLREPKEISND